ncbi:hypothetical protein INT47_001772 [Mucor saturninus]|uniref:Uncharacterized protein n=1 Tax=Mucor saturninus TaxID=64648 RepID=A0A8H7RJR9_9FUNG|nr:hypothetical protein INT47_001772 [Mucor saturninus]
MGQYHTQDITLPEKPRGISKYNVYCQQEKEKLLSDAEHTELEATVETLEKRNQMEALINTGLTRREIWENLTGFLKALYRFHGTEFVGIFGKNKIWNHVS